MQRIGKPQVAFVGAVTALVVVAVALVAGAFAGDDGDETARVYAASSLRDAFPKIEDATFSFAGSSELQRQVEAGAPADVFASASPKEAQALFHAGSCTRPVTFATNVLVLLIPRGNPGHLRSVYGLRAGGHRLAVGAPDVPIGGYTRTVLEKMGLSSILSSNRVSQETEVSSIVSKVALGTAEAGFAYITDAKIASGRVETIALPRRAQPPVRYQICRVRRQGAQTSAADSFIERVVGVEGRRVLRAAGFGLPPGS
jgi:molybdate transport system substrate-binding protein